MKINFDMFGSCMEDKVLCQILGPMLSQHSRATGEWKTPSSCKRFYTHIISAVALASSLYLALVEEWEIVACFWALKEIRFPPKNTVKPPIDLRSSTRPACPIGIRESARYHGIWFAHFESRVPRTSDIPQDPLDCTPVNRCGDMQKLTYFVNGITNVRSGESKILQGPHHTAVLCWIIRTKFVSIMTLSFSNVDKGVSISLQLLMSALARISEAYFCWDSTKPSWFFLT